MVKISKGFLTSTAIYTVAGALPMASAIILLPFFLAYLTTDNFGALSVFLAFSVLIQILTTYSFDTSVYIYYHEYKEHPEKLNIFISSSFFFMLMLGIGVATFFVIAGEFLFALFFEERGLSFFPYGVMAMVAGIFQSLFKVHSSLLQSSQKPVLFFWSNLLSFSLIAGLSVLGLKLYPQTLIGPLGGRMIAAIVSGLWAFVRILNFYGYRFDFSKVRAAFSYNNSSFIYQLQQWSVNYLDKFIMIFFLPLSTIGIYDFAMKCMLAIDFIINGLYNAFYPKVLGTIMKQGEKESTPEINRYYNAFTGVIMLLVCSAIPLFSMVIDLGFIRSGYEASYEYFPLIGIIYLIRTARYYFASPYGALKYSTPLPIIYLIVSLLKILLIVMFIKSFEVYSVIGASIISIILEIVLLWYFIRERFNFKFNFSKLILAPFSLALIILAMQFLHGVANYVEYSLYIVFCVVALAGIYRREIKTIKPFNFFT